MAQFHMLLPTDFNVNFTLVFIGLGIYLFILFVLHIIYNYDVCMTINFGTSLACMSVTILIILSITSIGDRNFPV
jgi:hypothetical protein